MNLYLSNLPSATMVELPVTVAVVAAVVVAVVVVAVAVAIVAVALVVADGCHG